MSACLSKIVEREDWVELDNFFDIIRKYEMKNITQNNPINETIFFIKHKENFSVDKSVKMAIFSLNTRKTIETSMILAGITDYIHFYVGREDVRHWKPEPEGLLRIKKHFNVSEEEMIYFGDLEKDLLAGKNAGVDSYYIEDLIALVKKASDVV
jgi:HAD superfamily hydrolase (TIGR01549 family)